MELIFFCVMCGRRSILDLNVGIIWNDFLGKTLSIKVNISPTLHDLHSDVLMLGDRMSLTS